MKTSERTAFCDELRLSFPDIDAVQAQNLREMIIKALSETESANGRPWAEDAMALVKMKTFYWSDTRGKHKGYTFSWYGVLSDAVLLALPLSWHKYISYIHSKRYHCDVNAAEYKELANRASDDAMFRKVTKVAPRPATKNREQAKIPLVRIASNKSDLQVTAYARPGQPAGFESRYKDEKLRRIMSQRIQPNVGSDTPRAEVWSVFLETLADDGFEMWRRLADECGMGAQSGFLGYPLTEGQLRYYFNFSSRPSFAVNGRLIDDKGFLPVPYGQEEEYQERRDAFADEFGLFQPDGREYDAR
jgi:hypothetical protein